MESNQEKVIAIDIFCCPLIPEPAVALALPVASASPPGNNIL